MSPRIKSEEFWIDRIETKNVTFISWIGDYVGSNSKVTVCCVKCHYSFDVNVHTLYYSNRKCLNCNPHKNTKKTSEQFTQLGFHFVEWCEPLRGNTTPVKLRCSNNHVFTTTPDNIRTGKCPECSIDATRTPEQTRITQIVSAGYVFNGWVSEYKNNTSRAIVTCPNNHTYDVNISNFVNDKTRCAECDKMSRPGVINEGVLRNNTRLANSIGSIYVLQCTSMNESFYKVGITTKDHARVAHDLTRHYNVDTLYVHNKLTMRCAYNIEQTVKKQFDTYNPMYKFGGYTECLIHSPVDFIQKTLKGSKNDNS